MTTMVPLVLALARVREMVDRMLAAEAKWLPQFSAGRAANPAG